MKRSDLEAFGGLPVSDADLRSVAPELLAILLDGVDVEALRQALNEQAQFGPWEPIAPMITILEAAEVVLAALEGETP